MVKHTLNFATLQPGAPRPASRQYTTRAAIRPDRRLQTSHPAGSAYVSDGRRRKTPLRTPDIAKRVEPPEASAQNMIKDLREVEPPQPKRKLAQSPALFSPVSMKLTAAATSVQALVLDERNGPARCLRSPYPAQKRLRKNGLSELRRVPRGDSEGRTAERCFQWATLAGLSSRIQA